MSYPSPISPPGEACQPASAPDRDAQDLAILGELADLAMELARAAQARALAELTAPQDEASESPTAKPPSRDYGAQFLQNARCVRQCLALRAKLAKEQGTSAAETLRTRRERRKQRIKGIVTEAIHEAPEGTKYEGIFEDLLERLEGNDWDEEDFGGRPLGEIVSRICFKLGVTPDYSFWGDAAWVREAMEFEASWAERPEDSAVQPDADPTPQPTQWADETPASEAESSEETGPEQPSAPADPPKTDRAAKYGIVHPEPETWESKKPRITPESFLKKRPP